MRRIITTVATSAAILLQAGAVPAAAAAESTAAESTAVAGGDAAVSEAPRVVVHTRSGSSRRSASAHDAGDTGAGSAPADAPGGGAEPAPTPAPSPEATSRPAAAVSESPTGADVAATQVAADATSTPAPDGLQNRVSPALATDPDGTVVLYGGVAPGGEGGALLADTWTWDGTQWQPRCGTALAGATDPCGPGPRTLASAATGPTGAVLYGGGDAWPFFDMDDSGLSTVYGDMWLWTGTTWQQVCGTGECAPGPRLGAAMAGNDVLSLLFGGISAVDPDTGDPTAVDDETWAFDGVTWTQLCGESIGLPCGPSARVGATMGWDGTRFVLFGGIAPGSESAGFMQDTWLFNGVTWELFCDGCGPEGRMFGSAATIPGAGPGNPGMLFTGGLAMTEGSDGSAMVLFGDLWHWAGAWNQLDSPWPERVVWDPALGGPPPPGTSYLPVIAAAPDQCGVIAFTARPDPGSQGAYNETVTLDVPGGYSCDESDAGTGGHGGTVVQTASVLPVTGSDWIRALLAAAGLLAAGAVLLGLVDVRSRPSRSARSS